MVTGARRWLPISGTLAVVAMGSTSQIAPPPPVAGAPAGTVLAYFTAHHVGLEIENVILSVGMILLMVFAATLHARLGTIASLTAFAAVAVIAACTLVEVAVFQALAYRPNPDAARATLLNDLQDLRFRSPRSQRCCSLRRPPRRSCRPARFPGGWASPLPSLRFFRPSRGYRSSQYPDPLRQVEYPASSPLQRCSPGWQPAPSRWLQFLLPRARRRVLLKLGP